MDDRSRSASATDFAVQLNCLSDSEQYDNKSSSIISVSVKKIFISETVLSLIYFNHNFFTKWFNEYMTTNNWFILCNV